MGANHAGDALSATLRNAPGMLSERVNQSYKNGSISAYIREVALQRVDLMMPIFNQYAGIIQARGEELKDNAIMQGMVEALAALGPGEVVGKFGGGLASGKAVDVVIGALFIKNSINEFEYVGKSFSAEESALTAQINNVMGLDAERLFIARMKHKINWAKSKWQEVKQNFPDEPEKAEEALHWEIYQVATSWAENPRMYGPGEKFATLNDYVDWMISLAKGETQPGVLDVTEINGDTSTYQGSMHWEKFGSDVAPELGMCSEVPAGVNFDQISIEIKIDPNTSSLYGTLSGSGTDISTVMQGQRNEGSFDGAIVSGSASRIEDGYWDFNGTAQVDLDFYNYTICVSSPENIGMALDAGAKLPVTAQITGTTRDGACIWWSELSALGDLKRDFYLYTSAMKDRCIAAIFSGSTP
jgi:hypothetical protein